VPETQAARESCGDAFLTLDTHHPPRLRAQLDGFLLKHPCSPHDAQQMAGFVADRIGGKVLVQRQPHRVLQGLVGPQGEWLPQHEIFQPLLFSLKQHVTHGDDTTEHPIVIHDVSVGE
jgi:hypothetical protein